jgi:hypothetical protein
MSDLCLEWAGTDDQPVPDCVTCQDRWHDPVWTASVHSVSIRLPGTPLSIGRRAIEQYHHDRHRD